MFLHQWAQNAFHTFFFVSLSRFFSYVVCHCFPYGTKVRVQKCLHGWQHRPLLTCGVALEDAHHIFALCSTRRQSSAFTLVMETKGIAIKIHWLHQHLESFGSPFLSLWLFPSSPLVYAIPNRWASLPLRFAQGQQLSTEVCLLWLCTALSVLSWGSCQSFPIPKPPLVT